jgi:uncharacterized Tic20 family protein
VVLSKVSIIHTQKTGEFLDFQFVMLFYKLVTEFLTLMTLDNPALAGEVDNTALRLSIMVLISTLSIMTLSAVLSRVSHVFPQTTFLHPYHYKH